MSAVIGIPRAMLYYEFGDLWKYFFSELAVPVIVSSETNKQLLHRGTMLAVDESCLPLKIYLGHVESLLPACTHLFIPRIVSYHDNFFLCAKFAGLPDIIQNTFNLSNDQLIAPNIENTSKTTILKAINTTCRALNISNIKGYRAYNAAMKKYFSRPVNNTRQSNKVALIGHSYLLNDSFFCRDILSTLNKRNIAIVTPEAIDNKTLYNNAAIFSPDIYWQLSAKIAGAVNYFSNSPDINGIILISSFGCGPDSLINEYLEQHVLKNNTKPYIIVNLDEHTGSAGIITRIEAFLDLVDWRFKY